MIHLIQPPRSRRLVTGGYRYNAEVGRHLQADGDGELTEVAPEDLASWCSELGSRSGIAVFDSLYLQLLGAPVALDSSVDRGRTRLLLHYLPSRGPRLSVEQRQALAAVEKAWIDAVGGVITTSWRLARQVCERVPGALVRVAPPGVSACFSPSRAGSDRGSDSCTVVAVGSLVPDKGQLEIVAALARLPAGAPSVRLVLIGDAEADPAYTAVVRRDANGVELELTGCLPPESVARHLRQADLFVSASTFESYGMATSEAVATGLPVLGYQVGEADEWIEPGRNGHLVEVGDQAGFRDKLIELVAEPDRLGALRAPAPRLPSWHDTCRQLRAACGVKQTASAARNGSQEPQLYACCDLPTEFGTFDVKVYETGDEGESILIQMGDLTGDEPPFVRVHSECFTGEVLHSFKCDCRLQLESALRTIAERRRGAVVYLRQEGRGIGLGNKIRAYAEQAKGADTVEANAILGFPTDLRDFKTAARILKLNSVHRVELNTNNPDKIASLEANGVAVVRVLPSASRPNPHNLGYLQTKYRALGHVGLEVALRGLERGERSARTGAQTDR